MPFRLLRAVLIGFVLLVIFLAGCQRRMIYHPARESEETLRREALRLGLEPWRDEAGTLIGWKTPAPPEAGNRPSAIIFHGNAGYALHRTYLVDCFNGGDNHAPWNVYLFEYPGYGARAGRPSERAILAAAENAIRPLVHGERPGAVVLVGESLGCGAACHLAGTFPDAISGLLLITPFPSLAAVGRHHYPLMPVRLLLRDRFENTVALRTYGGPASFVLAEDDEVIPPELGRALHDAYAGPKRLWVVEDCGHNTLDYHPGAAWWTEAVDFLMHLHAPGE
jgi:pimeloyl-ACP methyl ester carboxylesterase